uniref:Variant surface glycoprotein 624 n=1 Tax=Trypanosoma brucei TaxID=5691 RepID=M4T0H6_9TRYP|nr:variant surface glycoprotein 624 [Trypanosoma brucei]
MKKIKLLALIALLTLGTQTRYTAGNKKAMKVSAFKALCDISGELKKKAAIAGEALANLLSQAQKYRDISVDLHILGRQNETAELAAAGAVAFMADRKADKITSHVKEMTSKATHAAAATAYLSGFIDQTTSIFDQAAGSTDHCIAQENGNKNTNYSELAGCLTESKSHPAIPTSTAGKPDLDAKIKAVAQLNNQDKSSGTNVCLLTSTQSGHIGYGGTTNQPNNVEWVGGIMSFGNAALATSAFPKTASTIGETPLIKAATTAVDNAKTPAECLDAEAVILNKIADTTARQTFTDFDTTEQRVGQSEKTTQHKIKGADLTNLAAKLKGYRDSQGGEEKIQKKRKDYKKTYSRQLNEVTVHCQPMECEVRTPTKAEESECNSAGDDARKCTTLEKKGCTFNKESKKCELKKEMKADLEKANQEAGGNDEKTKSKWTCKEQKECTKSCKWENNACKDSSFLVHNKFALMTDNFMSMVEF